MGKKNRRIIWNKIQGILAGMPCLFTVTVLLQIQQSGAEP